MALWKDERWADLVRYLAEHGLFEDARVWKLAQAFFEILPRAGEDWKLVSALLAELNPVNLRKIFLDGLDDGR